MSARPTDASVVKFSVNAENGFLYASVTLSADDADDFAAALSSFSRFAWIEHNPTGTEFQPYVSTATLEEFIRLNA